MTYNPNREAELLAKASRIFPGSNMGNPILDAERVLVLTRGKGSRVWDAAGNEYIDYLMGSGPLVLGHSHPSVVEAVVEAVEGGSTFFAVNEKAILLAEEIVSAVPCADQVRFTTSGTDACFQAMRIARAHRRRDKILKFEGGFHGTSDYALMSLNHPATQLRDFPEPVPNSAGIPAAVADTVLIAPYNDIDTVAAIIEKNHDELAAVIVEPQQRVIPPAPRFLQQLRDVTSHYGIPLIFDEVVTGFRLAYGGAQEYYGVIPDLCTMGKIVGGGYPLAIVAGREELMSAFDPSAQETGSFVPQIGTLNGNPVAAAAGLATLAELRKEGAYDKLHSLGARLKEGIAQVFSEAEIPVVVSGEAPIFGFMFTDQPVNDYRDTLKADAGKMVEFTRLLLDQGLLKGWPEKMYVSLAHEHEIDATLEAFRKAVQRLKG